MNAGNEGMRMTTLDMMELYRKSRADTAKGNSTTPDKEHGRKDRSATRRSSSSGARSPASRSASAALSAGGESSRRGASRERGGSGQGTSEVKSQKQTTAARGAGQAAEATTRAVQVVEKGAPRVEQAASPAPTQTAASRGPAHCGAGGSAASGASSAALSSTAAAAAQAQAQHPPDKHLEQQRQHHPTLPPPPPPPPHHQHHHHSQSHTHNHHHHQNLQQQQQQQQLQQQLNNNPHGYQSAAAYTSSHKGADDHIRSATSVWADGVAPCPPPLSLPPLSSPSSFPRTTPLPAVSLPQSSRPHFSPASLSTTGAVIAHSQRSRWSISTSPTAAVSSRLNRSATGASDVFDYLNLNKALPPLIIQKDNHPSQADHEQSGKSPSSQRSESPESRPRPRASSAASATNTPPHRRNSYLTKQSPQLQSATRQLGHHASALNSASLVSRGSIDDVVPELGRAAHSKHLAGSHQQRPHQHLGHQPFKVDGSFMPTQSNAHLMHAPLRTATSGSMNSMTSGDTLVPSAGGSSISVSTSSTATRTTRQLGPKPLVVRNNRTYINDPSLPYPLPVDLQELHRQSLRTLLLFQLLGGPITSPVFASKPPLRVLEIGCGSGFWSMMCHRFFDQKGHKVSFTGMDIIPLCGSGLDPNSKPDSDMQWRFVQHDMRNVPWPFTDGEFDLVMAKDMSLVAGPADSPEIWDEYIRVLSPGGVLELWETDHTVRMLRPHAPPAKGRSPTVEEEPVLTPEEDEVAKLGVYTITGNTPLSPPTNTFLSDYNGWITKALDARGLSSVPNTQLGPWLLQEAESLTDIVSIRLAVPLSEIRWEREGVGGVVTKGDGKSYIDSSKGKYRAGDAKSGSKTLSEIQIALRRTALETVVGLIHSFEPILRETSGKSQDEWDGWMGKMMSDLMREGGTSWGECLEVGAWSAIKRG